MAGQIPEFDSNRFDAIAIGGSTGAPPLIERILERLPADLPTSIFIAQHLPLKFSATFAAQLDRVSPLTVVHAISAMPVYPGTVYIGQGQHHMRVVSVPPKSVKVQISTEPLHLHFKPSIDELFRSCAQVYGSRVLGVILSGIGSDGTDGALAIKNAGGVVIAQSAESCAAAGLPRSCVEAGACDAQLDPEQIRRAIIQLSPDHRHLAFA